MVKRKAAVTAALKYGPALAAAAKRYGPTVMDQLNKQREPAERLVRERRERGNPRRTAINHATTVIDGTLLRGYHRGQEFWVVFSGDDPVGVYPYTTVPYAVLLDHADLDRRLRPDQVRRRAQTGRRPGATSTGKAGPPGPPQPTEPDGPTGQQEPTGPAARDRGQIRALRPGDEPYRPTA